MEEKTESWKIRILLSSPENLKLSHYVQAKLLSETSDFFSIKIDHGSKRPFANVDLVITLSGQLKTRTVFFPPEVRRYHLILPLGNGEAAISDEIRLFSRELLQTFQSPTTKKDPLIDESWNRYYREGNTAWDLNEPSPPFVRLHQTGLLSKGKVAIPGCGKGNEVLYFAREGFDVTAIDFSDEAMQNVRKRLKRSALKANLVKENFLNLPGEYEESFDFVLEQTCYCAIEPLNRADYVRSAHRILRTEGAIIALFYDIENQDGPPFGTSLEEIRQRFSPLFILESLELCPDSHKRRAGKELLGRFRKRTK